MKAKTGKTSIKKMTKCEFQVRKCLESLTSGSVLAIDPSSGSQSSLPGYALFKDGKLVESGVLELNIRRELYRRLSQLAEILREEFDEVDVLVIEDIPVSAHGRGQAPHVSLLKAVGAILSSCKFKSLVEISPSTWKAFVKRNPDLGYTKSDAWDAEIMGRCCIQKAVEVKRSER